MDILLEVLADLWKSLVLNHQVLLVLLFKFIILPILLSNIIVYPFRRSLGRRRGFIIYLVFASVSFLIFFLSMYFGTNCPKLMPSCDVPDQFSGVVQEVDACEPISLCKENALRWTYPLFVFYIGLCVTYYFLKFLFNKMLYRK